jgi:hypothetical protein
LFKGFIVESHADNVLESALDGWSADAEDALTAGPGLRLQKARRVEEAATSIG